MLLGILSGLICAVLLVSPGHFQRTCSNTQADRLPIVDRMQREHGSTEKLKSAWPIVACRFSTSLLSEISLWLAATVQWSWCSMEKSVYNLYTPFTKLCRKHRVKHRRIKFRHPWTDGMIERLNRKIKKNVLRKYLFSDVDALKKTHWIYQRLQFYHPTQGIRIQNPY